MKRITFWPQGLAGADLQLGRPGRLDGGPPAGWRRRRWCLWLAGLAWTLGYDTIYAHQDKEDDAKIGVKSSALKLGDGSRPWVGGFYAVALALIAAAAALAGLHPRWPMPGLAAAGAAPRLGRCAAGASAIRTTA